MRFAILAAAFTVAFAASSATAQEMCANCEALEEKLRIVELRLNHATESIAALREARAEFNRNVNMADGFATAYAILQGVNVSLGLANLPCSIPGQWLRGLFAGTRALYELASDGSAKKVTLAAILGYAGLGVFSDMGSAYRFMQEWQEDGKSLESPGRSFDGQISEFQVARRNLRSERHSIQEDMRKAGCKDAADDLLDDLLGDVRTQPPQTQETQKHV